MCVAYENLVNAFYNRWRFCIDLGGGHMHLNDANVKMEVKFKEDPSGIALFPASTTHGSNVGSNVGPPSPTLAHHWSHIGSMCRVCWVVNPLSAKHDQL